MLEHDQDDVVAEHHLRHWHLMARMTEALETWQGDYQRLTEIAAAGITELIGDRTSVILLDPPGCDAPVVGTSHRREATRQSAERLFRELGDDGLRAWVHDFAAAADRDPLTAIPAHGEDGREPRHRRALRRYRKQTDIADTAYAPLRSLGGEIRGIVVCVRDSDSPPLEELDRIALGSAGDCIGVGLDLAAARARERRAAAQSQILEALAQSSPDFIAIATPDGELRFLNDAGRRLIGFPEDRDITQVAVHEFYTANARPIDRPFREWPQVAGPVWAGISSLRDWRDGSDIPVSARSFWVHDANTAEKFAVASVQRDIRKELATQQELADLAEQRRVLLSELVNAEQTERTRIAHEVHDESLQFLAASQLRLELQANQLRSGDAAAALRSAAEISDLVSSAQRQLRQLLLDLEPPSAAHRQLHEALLDTAKTFFGDTETQVTVTGVLTDVPDDVAAVFHRSTREAVSNARRHARAERVDIVLFDDPDRWGLAVIDDGVGVPEELPVVAGHLGVRGMINRAEALGGTCTVRRGEHGGTEVRITVPRPAPAP